MTEPLPVNASDLTAKAYGVRRRNFPVIPETLGLAVMLIVNRNTTQERAVWLTHPDVHEALCRPAEAFASALEERPSPEGWRGGALASLRSLLPGALHEATEPWPHTQSGEARPVARFWLEDEFFHFEDGWRRTPSPVRAELLRRLGGHPRIGAAWDALIDVYENDRRRGYSGAGYPWIRGLLAGWSSLHERPGETEWLHTELLGRDPAAERDARMEAASKRR